MYIQNTCHQYWTFCFIIQTQFQSSNPEVTCMCLDVIGKYVSWIDINLIANDKFVEVRLSSIVLSVYWDRNLLLSEPL